MLVPRSGAPHSRPPRQPQRPLAVALGLLVLPLALAGAWTTPARAYMALLRQGVESAEVPNALDHYGARVATGDFNGDGYDDLAVAAPDEANSIAGGHDHGVVIVSYGSARGITHLSADVLSVGDLADFQVNFGTGLAAGDFNGDGVDDLAVGIPGMDFLATQDIGAVWVYAGMDGVGISLAPYLQLQQSDVAGAADEANDQFGYTLAAGDVNRDGFEDLVASAIGEDNGAGVVFYFPGSAAGVTAAGSGFAKQSHLGSTDEPGSLFGYSLAIGDYYDSLHLDIAIGCPRRDFSPIIDAGQVYIVRGTAVGPVTSSPLTRSALSLGLGAQTNGLFGWSLAAGHFFEETGRVDLAIGEPGHTANTYVATGRVVALEFESNGQVPDPPVVLTQATTGDSQTPGAQFGWSLAAGAMLATTGQASDDGFDDLAVGAPNDAVIQPGSTEVIAWSQVGSAYIFPCSGLGPGPWGAKQLDAFQLNDLWFGFEEHLGWSLAFGNFDDSGYANLAIGVPDKTYPAFIDVDTARAEAGQVHIYAFWRQPSGRPHRGSIVYDCADRIMYAQRFKQRLTPASTTKALTALIACEAIQNDDVDAEQLYTVPAWAANNVTGSQYGLFPGERLSFIDLVRTMIAVSGNDCAYTIGDILTGSDNSWDNLQSTEWNLEHILEDFADIMNTRAAQLGMSPAHHFNNPAGRPYGQHWTTPEDMAIFVSAAMENELFRDIVGTENWNVQRWIPGNLLFPLLGLPPALIPVNDSVFNGYLDGITDIFPTAIGVKGGWNAESMTTGLYSGTLDNGRVTTTVFGIPPYGSLTNLGKELMSLVAADCTPWIQAQIVDFPSNPFPPTRLPRVPTDDGVVTGGSALIGEPNDDDLLVDIYRVDVGAPTTCFALQLQRTSEFELGPQQSRQFGVGALRRHDGLTLRNVGDALARVQIEVSAPSGTQIATLLPGDTWSLAPYAPSAIAPFSVLVTNLATSGAPAVLQMDEAYGFDLCLGSDRTTPPNWSVLLTRDGLFRSDNIGLMVYGQDAAGGSTVDISLHAAGVTTDAPAVETPSAAGPVRARLLGNFPNPFNPTTTIVYELSSPAAVRLAVYDVAGRLVRTLDHGTLQSAGRHDVRWDGRDDQGRGVASGMYVYRLDGGQAQQAGRMLLVK